jgi:MscS family membrane protein
MYHRFPRVRTAFSCPLFLTLALGVPGTAGPPAPAKPPAPPAPKPRAKEVPLAERLRSPVDDGRPLQDKLRSPRETLKTLYFAALVYDLFPEMIDDAVACLDLDGLQPRPGPADAALLALDLESVLQGLALPLSDAPDEAPGDQFVLHDAGGFRLALRRGPDGGWRFDADTLALVPDMHRATRERRRRPADVASLREGFTDPRATLRQFMSDAAHGDFYAAARALDLSALGNEQRRLKGPALAQQLAFVLQHRGFLFRQEVPDRPDGPPYTWHADANGRLALERVRQPDGKDAWLFTRQTVRNIPRMYAAAQFAPPDPRYVRLNMVIPGPQDQGKVAAHKRPDDVPAHLGSPRALLQGFFRTMAAAEANDAQLADALEYLDLDNVPPADRAALGGKLAVKLEAVLRKLPIDLRATPDDWNAPPQVLGEAQGVRVEITRQRDGWWCFSEATVARIPEMFDKLAGKARPEKGSGSRLDSARDAVMTFQSAARRRDFTLAAHCLNLAGIPASARDDLGPVLAFKLLYVLERIGRVYVEEIPDNPEGPRHTLYRGELGRIVLDRRTEEPDKGQWQFTPETVEQIDPMFRNVLRRPPDASLGERDVLAVPRYWDTPAAWWRQELPDWAQVAVGPLDLYQWLGLALAALASWAGVRLTMAGVTRLVAWLLRRGGSALSASFVASTLRPVTWLTAGWTCFVLLRGLDLDLSVGGPVFAAEKFLLAGLTAWLGVRLMDLSMAVYTNTEILLPHRSLSDMIVPVSVRLGKAVVVIAVGAYVTYQFGEIDLLGRFLTGLGVAGLAASLAAQDALKSYFGTLLLIGERAFKIGDRINVSGKEGVVEQVGFRSTRLRNADGSLLTIPNAVIAAAPIENRGARHRRRFDTAVVLSRDTALEHVLEFRGRLWAWLDEHPLVLSNEGDVRVDRVTGDGIELGVNLVLTADTPADETRFLDELRAEVLGLAESLRVGLTSACRASLLPHRGDAAEGPQQAA